MRRKEALSLDGYELTDRGKIIITVVLVLLIFVLPAAILLYNAVASPDSPAPDDRDQQASAIPPSIPNGPQNPPITESPPPNGGGFNPPDNPQPNGNGQGITPSPNGQDPPEPPESIGRVDSIEGTLSFLFSPDQHDRLGAGLLSMLDVFLGSPKNTQDSIIAVETPQLSLEDSERLISVVVSEITGRGIPQQRIAYATRLATPEDGSFEVKMYYIMRQPK